MSQRIHFLPILFVVIIVLALSTVTVDARPSPVARSAPIVVDHRHTDISQIPEYWINRAKELLRLSYGHTSHGSQLVTGMDAIKAVYPIYDFNTNGGVAAGILSLHDGTPGGDLGNPDRVTWAALTRTYLNGPTGTGPTRNVVMWSWCGQVSSSTSTDIDTYLNLMNQLETDYPTRDFIYMTGHLDGTGEAGNLKIRNQQIREYAIANNKVLFDFADIESYDPAGNYYPNESDDCSWCTTWCASHPADCVNAPPTADCAHSHGFNCLRKGQAFWWLMARLAGWSGPTPGPTQTITYRSVGLHDGWILESAEKSNAGGMLDKTATTFRLGDNAQDKQYRAILHFNTSTLPDNAIITKVTLKIQKQGLVGTDPFNILGGLKVDMRKPFFGTAYGLEIGDFQAAAGKTAIATFNATPTSNWYSAVLNATGRAYVNLTGNTQFRLYFATDDNNDNAADYMKFFSGNYATASVRPTLIIEYYVSVP